MRNADGEMDDLTALRAECEQLRAENAHLRSRLGLTETAPSPAKLASPPAAIAAAAPNPLDSSAPVTSDSPVAAKLALFRSAPCAAAEKATPAAPRALPDRAAAQRPVHARSRGLAAGDRSCLSLSQYIGSCREVPML